MSTRIIELETTSIDRFAKRLTYVLPDGKMVVIGNSDQDFFRQLCELPAHAKIKLMGLTSEDMEEYMKWENKQLRLEVIDILNKDWSWRETGDPIESFAEIPGIKDASITQVKANISKGRKFSTHDLKLIIEFFTGDRSDVYINE